MAYKIYFLSICILFTIAGSSQVRDTFLVENGNGTEWIKSMRTITSYTPTCNISYALQQNWDIATSKWVDGYQSIYTYDNANKLQQVVQQQWNGSNWINIYRTVFNYGNITSYQSRINQAWDPLNEIWTNIYRVFETSIVNNKFSAFEFDTYTNNNWLKSGRTFFEYNNAGQTTKVIYQNWINEGWKPGSVINVVYGQDTSASFGFNWDSVSMKWQPRDRSFYSYVDGSMLTDKQFNQIYTGKSWENSGRGKYNYDSAGVQKSFVSQNWDAANKVWVKFYRTGYRSNDSMYRSVFEYWDPFLQTWANSTRLTSTKHGCQLSFDLVDQDVFENAAAKQLADFKNAGKLVYDFDINGKSENNITISKNLRLIISAKGNVSNAISQANALQHKMEVVHLYPNPAKDYFIINADDRSLQNRTVKITDVSGKLLLQKQISGNQQRIDISTFTKGTYIVTITSNTNIKTGKLLVQ